MFHHPRFLDEERFAVFQFLGIRAACFDSGRNEIDSEVRVTKFGSCSFFFLLSCPFRFYHACLTDWRDTFCRDIHQRCLRSDLPKRRRKINLTREKLGEEIIFRTGVLCLN